VKEKSSRQYDLLSKWAKMMEKEMIAIRDYDNKIILTFKCTIRTDITSLKEVEH
jgi:hypothetical protein